MTWTPPYLRPHYSQAREDYISTGFNAVCRPRRPDAADFVPDPRRSPLAEQHLAEGQRLDFAKAQQWAAAQVPRPSRAFVGPSMAQRLGLPPTTPPTPSST